jgi:hypothetical protein
MTGENSDNYVKNIERLAKNLSEKCDNDWRIWLHNSDVPFGGRRKPNRCCVNASELCGQCIKCPKCNYYYNSSDKLTIHGSAGDFENFPEVYIAAVLEEPWYNKKVLMGRAVLNDLVCDNHKKMLMTEDEILEGLHQIQLKWPDIIGCLHLNSLYIAIIARMPKVIKILTNWMEKRNWYYTLSGKFAHLSHFYEKYNDPYSKRLDTPPLENEGPHNLPLYFNCKDGNSSTMNLNHAIMDWVSNNTLSLEVIHLLGRALAANGKQWETICCGSMNLYEVLPEFVGCISHCINNDNTVRTITNAVWYGSTPMTDNNYSKIIWHTKRSRCFLCKDETHSEHNNKLCCYDCLPYVVTEPFPMKPYEIVIAHAVTIRRRRFRGLLRCATVLIGRAKIIHFRPGIGQYFKEGLDSWNKMCSSVALKDKNSEI